jgi:hypothetical protein
MHGYHKNTQSSCTLKLRLIRSNTATVTSFGSLWPHPELLLVGMVSKEHIG